jgi:HPt (histidine-containing phosphotransfer) domain-containing protein
VTDRLSEHHAHVKPQPHDDVPPLVLDIELFQELRESLGNELEVVARLYERFLGSAANGLEELRRHAGTQRTATLHTLKGSAAMVGANRIAVVAARLQEALAHEPDEVVEAGINELEGELARFRLALTHHLSLLGYQTKP